MAETSSALGFNNREEELLQTVQVNYHLNLQKRKDPENHALHESTVQVLSLRMEEQREQLAQVKEDNIVLRSQVELNKLY